VDIVERLRGSISDEDNNGQLLEDAADEIVKLRDALKSYAACGDGCTCGDGWSHDIANAALTHNVI